MDKVSFEALHQRLVRCNIFSQRLLQRFLCRLPVQISQAILSVQFDNRQYKQYLGHVAAALKGQHYFSDKAVQGAVTQVRGLFKKFLESRAKVATYPVNNIAEILREAGFLCVICQKGLYDKRVV